jgi:hypothetical protein
MYNEPCRAVMLNAYKGKTDIVFAFASDDFARAFRAYDAGFRPVIEDIQAEAVRTGVETLVPRTEEAIRARNARTGADF